MRKTVVFIIGFTALGLLASEALAITNLTRDQVNNVCGKDLKTSNGHSGCSKKCADGKSTCIYDCSEKTGICSGIALGVSPSGGH
jgi:hypothetical protein